MCRLLNSYRDEFQAKSPKSLAIWQQNRTVMPGGRPISHGGEEGKGSKGKDTDGNEYLDFMDSFRPIGTSVRFTTGLSGA